jgi:predicted ATPase
MDASFPLGSLNIFSGLNGMGKFSLIQTLLLLRQSFERNTLFERGLLLKGDYVSLGTGQDILSEQAESNSIEFIVSLSDREPVNFCFDYSPQSDLQPIKTKVVLPEPESISLFNHNFQYLSADRISPSASYVVSDYHILDLNSLGNHGEYTAHFIAEYGLKPLNITAFKHQNATSNRLLDNLEHWMSELSPGLRIHTKLHQELNSVSLGYAFIQEKEMTADFKPQNVGFGLTFVLPVLTAILRSKPGDLLIIENPESHLHPAGQSLIGRMCAMAASNGVQLFVESHSDHFLNGIRVAVKQGVVKPDVIKLFFIERDSMSVNHSSTVQSPSIDSDGRIDYWPSGFFDEWDNQLEKLL